jgi:hypothetical protein
MAVAVSALVAPGVVAAPTAGRAAAWGCNMHGQLGDNTTTDSKVPVAVNTAGVWQGRTVTAIAVGGSHSAVLSAAPPQPPTAVGALPGSGQVSVSWTAPADDGGSPLLEYVATGIPGGATCTSPGVSCVVSGLTNGTVQRQGGQPPAARIAEGTEAGVAEPRDQARRPPRRVGRLGGWTRDGILAGRRYAVEMPPEARLRTHARE